MAQEENRERRPRRPNVAVLGKTAYRILLAASYSVWGGLLIILGYTHRFTMLVKRDDFLPLTSTTAALAAIALAILTYLHETASRDRYLKLDLAGLTSLFLLATTTGFLAAITFGSTEKTLHVRFVLLGLLYLCTAATLPVGALLQRLNPIVLSMVSHVGVAYDHSIFLAAAATFVVWSSDVSFAAVTVVATLGGMMLLLCSTFVMLVTLWRTRTHREDLEEQIVEKLRSARRKQQEGSSTPQEIPLSYLRNCLLSNDETLLDAIEGLQSEDRIIQVGHLHYYILEPDDWQLVEQKVLTHEAVVLSDKVDGECWKSIFDALERETRLPKQLLREYFSERIRQCVSEHFDSRGRLEAETYGRDPEAKLELCIKPGAFDRLRMTLKSEIAKLVPNDLTESVGEMELGVLSSLPAIDGHNIYYRNLLFHLGSLVLKDYNAFLDSSDWRRFDALISTANLLLVSK